MLITPKMSNILRDIIFEQNKELLTRIANDHFENDEENCGKGPKHHGMIRIASVRIVLAKLGESFLIQRKEILRPTGDSVVFTPVHINVHNICPIFKGRHSE